MPKPDFTRERSLSVSSVEWRLLILAACLNLDDSASDEIKELLEEKVDWAKLIAQSSMHGTAGLLYRHLFALSKEVEVPEEVLERLKAIYLTIAVNGLRQIYEFKKFAESLEKAHIEIIVLKGAALATNLYGDFGLRPLSDVDILVRERDWPKIYELLSIQGYTFASINSKKQFSRLSPKLTKYDVQSHLQYISKAGTVLEFQFDLFTLGIGMYDIAGVWDRSLPTEIEGIQCRVLSPEDELLLLAIHANRHGCMRLKWLVDIVERLQQNTSINWKVLISIAHREKIMASLYMTLVHIERMFDKKIVPAEVLERMKPKYYQSFLWSMVWPQKELDQFCGRNEDSICFYYYRPLSGWNLINLAVMGRLSDKIIYQLR